MSKVNVCYKFYMFYTTNENFTPATLPLSVQQYLLSGRVAFLADAPLVQTKIGKYFIGGCGVSLI